MSEFTSKHALIIGVTDYPRYHSLQNCVHDAENMRQMLIREANFAENNIRILKNPKAEHIYKEVRWLEQAALRSSDGGLALFFFSGHAVMYKGRLRILDTDFNNEEDQIICSSYPVEEIISVLEGYHTGLVFLDACRKEFKSQVKERGATAGNNKWHLLPDKNTPGDVLIGHACPLYGAAQDGGDLGNGVYTSQLLGELFVPGQSVLAAVSKANRQVYILTKGAQDPRLESRTSDHFHFFSLKMHLAFSLHNGMDDWDNKDGEHGKNYIITKGGSWKLKDGRLDRQ